MQPLSACAHGMAALEPSSENFTPKASLPSVCAADWSTSHASHESGGRQAAAVSPESQ